MLRSCVASSSYIALALWAGIISLAGCGATKSYVATEQLLLSDAVDESVAQLDFTPLAGQKVFLDTQFVSTVRNKTGLGFVGHEYLISSVRQRMLEAGCKLAADREQADLIAELRVGAMGTDGHSVVMGIPATNPINSLQVDGSPLMPSLPEISVAKRESMTGGAKVSVFAYQRESRQAVWQSGIAHATSDANDTWVLGIGPRQQGSIHEHDDPRDEPAKKSKLPISSVVKDQAKHRTNRTAARDAAAKSSAQSR